MQILLGIILLSISISWLTELMKSDSKETWEDRMADHMRYEEAREKGLIP